jgi:hypothetical protein
MLNAAGELVPGDSAADAAAAAADAAAAAADAAAAAAVPARPAKLAKSKQPGESGDAAPAPASGGVSLAGIYRPPGKRPFKQQPRLAQLRVVKRPDGSTIPYDCDPLTVKEPLQPSQLVLALNSAFREVRRRSQLSSLSQINSCTDRSVYSHLRFVCFSFLF